MKRKLTKIAFAAFTLSALALVLTSAASAPKKGDYDWLKARLEVTKSYTIEVLQAMPEKDYDFKPDADQRTFKAQAYHIAYSIDYFERALSNPQAAWNPGDENSKSKEELIKWTIEKFDAINKMILESDASDARTAGIISYLDHNAHHRGQIITYLRLKGIKPPNYK
ncbi:MAG: hypothetical protein COW03_15255 [Cytophagales bacterium CG12_big_fil_rev_8_21_14_0_65_40_12]|nr:MAG: hypothetical protein COW03_15255 [Cytophagales bacterium CG12_big_fil_rev_8_21_14_0_65_40_12]PIW04652.1 MAG: hypothetical protein COW40_08525 [Cytophagales bacterium CG17_big_fil_post_rev_8_21_14_2_50_40_13]